MKIGILTFIGTQSHGACLQAYALKECLNKFGYEVEIINYVSSGIVENRNKLIPWKAKGLKRKLGALKNYPIVNKRIKKFLSFEKKYLKISKYNNTIDAVLYDAIICGSDQVWNPEITKNDTTFFLEFLKNNTRKLTYAVSLGIPKFPKDLEEKYISLIKKFEYINVREKELKNYLQKYIPQKKIEVVLDPTQLISKEIWENLIDSKPLIKIPYMLVHYPYMNDETWNKIYEISNEKNLNIIFITNKIKKYRNVRCLYSVSPIEYLNYIKYAEVIVTGSFHTLSFSLIFNKEFWCTQSSILNRNSRISNLLNYASLSNRLLQNYNHSIINYDRVNKYLDKEREKSLSILQEMIKNKR